MGSKEVEHDTGTSETTIPQWLQDHFQSGMQEGDDLYSSAKQIAAGLGGDPREILGQNPMEEAGLEETLKGIDTGERFLGEAGNTGNLDEALAGLKGFDTSKLGDYNADELRGFVPGAIEGRSYADSMDEWSNRFTDDVINTTGAAMDRDAATRQTEMELANAATGGTSNSRHAIQAALAGNLDAESRAKMEATLRSEGFDKAAALSQGEMGQYLQQQQLGGDLTGKAVGMEYQGLADALGMDLDALNASVSGEMGRSNLMESLGKGFAALGGARGEALSGYGGTARALGQQQMDETRTAPQQATSWLAELFNSSRAPTPGGVGKKTGSQVVQEPGAAQQALGIGTSLLGAWLSDENAKENIEEADTSGDMDKLRKWTIANYNYKEDAPGHRTDRHRGLLAGSLEATDPSLVTMGDDGLKRIDAFSVAATVVGAMKELDAKIEARK